MSLLPLDESRRVDELSRRLFTSYADDQRFDRYYEGSQRLAHIGLAVPPELRKFETVLNWCRTVVDSVSDRMRMKAFYLPGEDRASEALRESWDYNNLDSESIAHHQEMLILGRGFVSVGANEEDPEFPLIQVENPRELAVDIDHRHRRLRAAVRVMPSENDAPGTPSNAVLYLPDSTMRLKRHQGRWVVEDRDDHGLGRVPLVMFLNRRRVGQWTGVSEMVDAIPLVDAAARSLTNLQLAGETHSVPQKYVLGMSKGDFVDAEGKPIPAWEAYFNAIWANQNKDAKVGQFAASDLSNFHNTVDHYASKLAGLYGLPARYVGITSVNPAAEGAIRAEEARLILNVEKKAALAGDGWGWVMGLVERFRTGEWVSGSRIKTDWFDAGTPTYAQRADALTKMYNSGQGILSREGVWEELGWSEARMERERSRFEAEARAGLVALEKVVDEGA
nr:MAG TPA: PORTAL PROTEIN [Caudoviricetes sp.]